MAPPSPPSPAKHGYHRAALADPILAPAVSGFSFQLHILGKMILAGKNYAAANLCRKRRLPGGLPRRHFLEKTPDFPAALPTTSLYSLKTTAGN
jgi:hypothetical protein